MDVRDAASVARGRDEIYERFGGVDVLVNNAGIGMRTVNPRFLTDPQPFWAVAPEGFADVLETKVTGCFLVARAVVPRMLAAGSGRVITISMNEQTMIRRGFVPYGPAGAAVEALARVMAADLAGSPVTANVLLPGGATATGMIPDDVSPADAGDISGSGDHGAADRLARLRGGAGRSRRTHRRHGVRGLAGRGAERPPASARSRAATRRLLSPGAAPRR